MIHFAEVEDEVTLCGESVEAIDGLYKISVTNDPDSVTCEECRPYPKASFKGEEGEER